MGELNIPRNKAYYRESYRELQNFCMLLRRNIKKPEWNGPGVGNDNPSVGVIIVNKRENLIIINS